MEESAIDPVGTGIIVALLPLLRFRPTLLVSALFSITS